MTRSSIARAFAIALTLAFASGTKTRANASHARVFEYARRVARAQCAQTCAFASMSRASKRARTFAAVTSSAWAYGAKSTLMVAVVVWTFVRVSETARVASASRRRFVAFASVVGLFVVVDVAEKYVGVRSGYLNSTSFNAYKAFRYDVLRLWSYGLDAIDADERGRERRPESVCKVLRYVLYPPLRTSGPLVRFREFERHRDRRWGRVLTSCAEIADSAMWFALMSLACGTYYAADSVTFVNDSVFNAVAYAWTHTTAIWASSAIVFTIPHALALLEGQIATPDVTLDWRKSATSFSHFWRTFHASLNEAFVAYIYEPLGSTPFALLAVMAFSLLFHGFSLAWTTFFAVNFVGLAVERAFKAFRTENIVCTAAYQTALFMLFTFCSTPIIITPAYVGVNFALFLYCHAQDRHPQSGT